MTQDRFAQGSLSWDTFLCSPSQGSSCGLPGTCAGHTDGMRVIVHSAGFSCFILINDIRCLIKI